MINLEVFFSEGEYVIVSWLEMFCVAPPSIHFIAAIVLALDCQEQNLVLFETIGGNVARVLAIVYAFGDYLLSTVRSDCYVDLLPFISFSQDKV